MADQLRAQLLRQTLFVAAQLLQPVGLIRAHQFGCSGGRGGALIGDKIGNGEIDLMADAADDRQLAGRNRARHDFLVERPQIFQRAAAATDDQHVQSWRGDALRIAAGSSRPPPTLHGHRNTNTGMEGKRRSSTVRMS